MGWPIPRGRKGSSSIRTPEQVRWDYVRQWLEKATDDLWAAELILVGELPTYWTVSFHVQQTAEKALKALLTRHQIEFAKTHSIGELLQLAEPVTPGTSARLDAARDLTRHAVTDRYPGERAPVPVALSTIAAITGAARVTHQNFRQRARQSFRNPQGKRP